MNGVLESLRSIDLAASAREVLTFIDGTDPCFVALIVGLFVLLGSKMAAPYPALYSWGMRLGVAAFLIYGGYSYFALGGFDTQDLLKVAVRGFIAAGLVLAPFWIVLPVLTFVYARLRLALAAFLIYAGYAFVSLGGFDAEQLPAVALRSLIAAGLVLVVAWILQPVIDFVAVPLFGKGKQPQPWAPPPARPAQEPRPTRAPQQAVRREGRDAAECTGEAPRRRTKSRLRAEVLYARHEPDVGDRFTRFMFDEFVERYLGDRHAPEDVEEHLLQLEEILRAHAVRPRPPESFGDLAELTRWYLSEQKRLSVLDTAEHVKQEKAAVLHQRYQQLAEQVLERPAV